MQRTSCMGVLKGTCFAFLDRLLHPHPARQRDHKNNLCKWTAQSHKDELSRHLHQAATNVKGDSDAADFVDHSLDMFAKASNAFK
mmetsp:Transcript_47653/g.110748  ORF Transcript_47653/g.110748 Transcript_47653/m.110748 type:complete len:85 (+) Transcript_47653:103-357(+)